MIHSEMKIFSKIALTSLWVGCLLFLMRSQRKEQKQQGGLNTYWGVKLKRRRKYIKPKVNICSCQYYESAFFSFKS